MIIQTMALRATKQHWWASIRNVEMMGRERSLQFSTNTQKVKDFASSTMQDQAKSSRWQLKAEYAPVYIVFGFVSVVVCLGIHTVKQNLFHGPAVQINKKRRVEEVAEVEHPDDIVKYADKYINKSVLRSVGHIQERDPSFGLLNPFTRSRDVETLKSVGALESKKK